MLLLVLVFYYLAFGRGLVLFASATEVFAVSLSKVGPLYLYGGIGCLIGWWSHESDEEIDNNYKERDARIVKYVKRNSPYVWLFLCAFIFIINIWSYLLDDYVRWIELQFPLVIFGIYASQKSLEGVRATQPIRFIGMVAALVIGSISLNGLADGTDAAKIIVSADKNNSPSCNGYIILKDVSDYFLAADLENNRILVDKDCDLKFLISEAENLNLRRRHTSIEEIVDHYTVRD